MWSSFVKQGDGVLFRTCGIERRMGLEDEVNLQDVNLISNNFAS
jgi:hypothetical protein